jgi:hypothetical protein
MIRFDAVSKQFPDGTKAVDELTLEAPNPRGEPPAITAVLAHEGTDRATQGDDGILGRAVEHLDYSLDGLPLDFDPVLSTVVLVRVTPVPRCPDLRPRRCLLPPASVVRHEDACEAPARPRLECLSTDGKGRGRVGLWSEGDSGNRWRGERCWTLSAVGTIQGPTFHRTHSRPKAAWSHGGEPWAP